MLTTPLRWVPDAAPARLAMAARPRGGEWLHEELSSWQCAGVRAVVSLLEPSEIRELELKAEQQLCIELGMSFFSLPIRDRGVPLSAGAVRTLVGELVGRLEKDQPIVVHCRAGIGRSGVLAACVLLALGVTIENVFPALSRARGVAVPDTPEQADWVRKYWRSNGAAL